MDITETIIWRDSLENLKLQKFKEKQKITYFCKICGNPNTVSFHQIKRNTDEFLCRKCRLRKSWIQNYGSMENYIEVSKKKRDKTNLKKYGTTNINSLSEIKQKIKQTNLERYGCEDTNKVPEIARKKIETFLKNYGVDNPNKSPKIKEKIRRTNLERYGVEWTHQAEEVIEKGRKTTRERYGVDNISQLDYIKEKKKKTCRSHFGVDAPFQSKDIIAKYNKNSLKKYGTAWPQCSQRVKDKQAASNLEKYGTISTAQSHYSEKTRKILFDKENFIKFMDEEANKSPSYGADLLEISLSTMHSYVKKYDLEDLYFKQFERSKYEEELGKFLEELNIDFNKGNRDIIKPLELDIYIPSHKLAIEFNGDYWHSDLFKDPNYHQMKSNLCFDKGIELIHIFEYEWLSNKDKLKIYLKDKLINPTEYDSGEIKEISEEDANKFLKENSLGPINHSDLYLSLCYNEEIIELISLSRSNHTITNYSHKFGFRIKNALDKFLKYLKLSDIIYECDYSKSSGRELIRENFTLEKITSPGLHIIKNNSIKDPLKIYDCGRIIYKKCLK